MRFEDLRLTRQFLDAAADAGYTEATPIQQKAIPAILSGQQVIGIAPTGTGKTASFLLPILQQLKYAQGTAPRTIIVAPSKELVVQTASHIAMLAKYTDLRYAAIYGGVGKTEQTRKIRGGLDLLVSTPRRLFEFYEDGVLELRQVKFLVIDEADRLMDMGFQPQLEWLLEILPPKKQTVLFSATFSDRVEKLTEDFLEYPVKIEVSPESTPADTIQQFRYAAPNIATKLNLLGWLLRDESLSRVMIFVRTKENAGRVEIYLKKHFPGMVKVLHSNKAQNTRINALNDFRDGEVRMLVATDVIARGIDISGVTHVINFDVPLWYEDYVHRIGRTGRAGNEGVSITMYNDAEEYHIEQIEKKIRMKVPEVKFPKDVQISATPFEEQQLILREIDARRKKTEPGYQGAFHDKGFSAGQERKKVTSKYGRHQKRDKK